MRVGFDYHGLIVERLIRSRQLARLFGLPVYVAQRPPAPFRETPIAAADTATVSPFQYRARPGEPAAENNH
jgi:hypothetical protein